MITRHNYSGFLSVFHHGIVCSNMSYRMPNDIFSHQTTTNVSPSGSHYFLESACNASSRSGISSALPLTCFQQTFPNRSTANAPPVCQRLPLSVGRFQIPSVVPNLYTDHRTDGLIACKVLLRPKPHWAYRSRSESTTTFTFHVPPTRGSQRSVASAEEWETAMQLISSFSCEIVASSLKVFSATALMLVRSEAAMERWTHKGSRSVGGRR